MERLEQQLAFIREVDRVKEILRQTWLADGSRQENDAEHSWHMALMCALLAEYANEPIDVGKTMLMILIHDLVEIDAGDTYAYDTDGKATQEEREKKAADRIFALLPADQAVMLRGLWEEFEAKQTPEARFANAMDRVQPVLLNDASGGVGWLNHGVFIDQVQNRIACVRDGSEPLWKRTEEILEKNADLGLLRRRVFKQEGEVLNERYDLASMRLAEIAGEIDGKAAGEENAEETVAGEEIAEEMVAGEEIAEETVAGEEIAEKTVAGEEIAEGEDVCEAFLPYVKAVAGHLSDCCSYARKRSEGSDYRRKLKNGRDCGREFSDKEAVDSRYIIPDLEVGIVEEACEAILEAPNGEDAAHFLAFFARETKGAAMLIREGRAEEFVAMCEEFLDLYQILAQEKLGELDAAVRNDAIRRSVYYYVSDYADVSVPHRIRQLFDPDASAEAYAQAEDQGQADNQDQTETPDQAEAQDQAETPDQAEAQDQAETQDRMNVWGPMAEKLVQEMLEELEVPDASDVPGAEERPVIRKTDAQVGGKFPTIRLFIKGKVEASLIAAVRQKLAARGIRLITPGEPVLAINKDLGLCEGWDDPQDNAVFLDKGLVERKLAVMRGALEEVKELAGCLLGTVVWTTAEEEGEPEQAKKSDLNREARDPSGADHAGQRSETGRLREQYTSRQRKLLADYRKQKDALMEEYSTRRGKTIWQKLEL